MDIVSLIVAVIVIGVLWWAVNALAGAFGLPAPIIVVLHVVVVLLALIYFLRTVGYAGRGLG